MHFRLGLKFYVTILIILVLVNVFLWTNFYLVIYKNSYAVIPTDCMYYEPVKEQDNITVEQAIDIVNEHFGISYRLRFDDIREQGILGTANFFCGISWFNIVTLDNDLTGWDMLYVLTHELCHIKYYTADETFTEYMTFVELYESENEFMHNRGDWIIREQVYYKRKINTEYDCAYYIIEYLKEKGTKN